MSQISKAYEPQDVEKKWYFRWVEDRCFHADETSSKPAYSIVIPPPNVTGMLTLGHVLNNTLQDILARRARMQGKEVLWLPGTDHAGIATQTAVEKMLRKEGRTRHDLGRDEFLKKVWEWKEKHGGIIIEQLKKLGCSCDWDRERFTMDAHYSRAVQRAFVDLFEKGCIYRGKRMVNWCPGSLTALSDEEVIMTPQQSTLYYMKYPVVEEPGTFLEIATTRPETLMGDTGVAVNPDDSRYAHLVGKHCRRPFPEADIPIVADEHIDPHFGTGVLKVTPAHDKADFEIGQRHGLEIVDVLNPDGTLNGLAGKDFVGMERFDARKLAARKLADMGLLVREEPYLNNIGISERAQVPIEPRLSEQWFLRYPQLRESLDLVHRGDIDFVPARWVKVFEHWIEKNVDWCLSRQLWWGHRIPVWYRGDEVKCQIESPGDDWDQDPDVLDTWFSSWLWPFETMDEATEEKFYPTNDLVTGPDIIFLWVARMIMAGLEFRGEKPFSHVFFTSLIRDIHGRKMSKSLGNSPNPLDLIDKYGADGLRFGLMRIAPQGQDIRFDEKQIEEGRNFANKLWNAARFRQMQGPGVLDPQFDGLQLSPYSIDILAKLDALIGNIETAYCEYRFGEIAQHLYDFFWSQYCDWYVEAAKTEVFGANESSRNSALTVMDYVISRLLRLLHPFMPHITEELWDTLGYSAENHHSSGTYILYAAWPTATATAGLAQETIATARAETTAVYKSVHAVRNLRAEYRIPSNRKVRFILRTNADWISRELDTFARLANADQVKIDARYEAKAGIPRVLTELGEIYMPLEGLIDVNAELSRLEREIEKTRSELQKVVKKLANENFTSNAPAEVVATHRQRETDWNSKLKQLRQMKKSLEQ